MKSGKVGGLGGGSSWPSKVEGATGRVSRARAAPTELNGFKKRDQDHKLPLLPIPCLLDSPNPISGGDQIWPIDWEQMAAN